MRFVLAISALVLSGILLILGIGQVTFLAGPRAITYSETFESANGLAVIDAAQFDAETGQSNVVVSGETAFVAVGKTRDVDAWVAPFDHLRVESDSQAATLQIAEVRADAEASAAYAESIGAEEGEPFSVPSPFGSDLWLEQRGIDPELEDEQASDEESNGDASLNRELVRLPVSLSEGQSVLVSVAPQVEAEQATADQAEGAQAETEQVEEPSQISIEWIQDRRTPWAGPLLVAGGVFALLGAVLYLLAVDHDRKGLGPRRGRRGPLLGIRNIFKRSPKTTSSTQTPNGGNGAPHSELRRELRSRQAPRLLGLTALGLAGALALSGCAPSYWPDFSQEEITAEESEQESEPTANLAPVPVTQTQVDRIIADIADLAAVADDELDASGLDARFTGDALTQREANYKIRSAVSDYEVVVPRITEKQLGYQLVQSTEGWPRTVFVVVSSESLAPAEESDDESDESASEADAAPSLALIMTQAAPHEKFLVSRAIALRGGITMPEAAPAEEGTALLADDLQTLTLTPAEVGPAYAAILTGGTGVEEAEFFDLEGDSLIERSGAAWVAQSKEAASAAGQGIVYSVSAEQSDSPLVSMSTGVGGALVATTVLETRVEAPEEGGRWRPTVPKSLSALSGLEGQQEQLVSTVAHQLLFFVPSKSSGEPIQLLGYTSDLVAAGNE